MFLKVVRHKSYSVPFVLHLGDPSLSLFWASQMNKPRWFKKRNTYSSHPNQVALTPIVRGIQYVHCVMHKSIMVKVGGGTKILADQNQKFVPKRGNRENFGRSQINFSEKGGKSETRGKCIIASGGNGHPCPLSLNKCYLHRVTQNCASWCS